MRVNLLKVLNENCLPQNNPLFFMLLLALVYKGQNYAQVIFNSCLNFLVAVANTWSTKTHSSKEIAEFIFENAVY